MAYEQNGIITEDFSTNLELLNHAEPVYKEFAGDFGDLSGCKSFEELPEKAREYIGYIEEYMGIPVKFIGTGAEREAMIIRD